MIKVICCPIASSGVYPNIRSALLFQLVMMPSRFLLIMASSEEATIAAKRPVISSACFGLFISSGDDLSTLGCHRIAGEPVFRENYCLYPSHSAQQCQIQ